MESVSIFPPPPGYSALFDEGASQEERQFPLSPPEIPTGQYVVFGELQEVETGIPKLTVEQLFNEDALDFKRELHRLHQEVLETYAELIQTVVHQPERYARLTERIGVLIRNMIQIVNLMRPCQAVMSLETFLQKSIAQREATLNEIRACKERALELLQGTTLTHGAKSPDLDQKTGS